MMLRNNIYTRYSKPLWWLLLSLLTLPTVTFAANDNSDQARQLINQMSRASRELNYDGIFVYRRGKHMDTMRLIHKSGQDGEQERMVALTGFAREVIRDNQSVTCIFPDNRAVMVEKSRPRKLIAAKLPEPIEKIADFYSFSVAGKDRVAGRSAWIVNIIPRDDYRYGYHLWIDEETNLLLKSELKDGDGRSIEQILFTQLHIVDDISPELLKPAITGIGFTWHSGSTDEIPVRSGTNTWSVREMPAGFSLSDYEKQAVRENDMPVEHIIYSDGVAMVSIFVEKIENEPDEVRGASSMGGVNAYSTYMHGYQVTAVGEVPQKTVQLMANSVVQVK